MFKRKNINFDINAISMPSKRVLKAVEQLYCQGYANPSAAYKEGREAMEMVEKAREKVAKALGCDSDEIIFTSGASESNSLVQANCLLDVDERCHDSIQRMPDLPKGKIRAISAVVSETGEWCLDEAKYNTEQEYFVDLTQAIGKMKIDLHSMSNVMFASASGQKFGGIQGCGILYINKNCKRKLKPLIWGNQENGLRGGTYNLPAIVAFGEAIEEATKNIKKNNEKIRQIVDYIYKKIKCGDMKPVNDTPMFLYDLMGVGLAVDVRKENNVINLTFKNLSATTAVQIFDRYGINISAGSACHSGSEEPSEAYLVSGYSREEALRTIRVSVGCNNTMREAKKFIKVLKKILDNYDI